MIRRRASATALDRRLEYRARTPAESHERLADGD
jgi:hypothetical protein